MDRPFNNSFSSNFSWNKKQFLEAMLPIYGFHSENDFGLKLIKKNLEYWTFLLHYKLCVSKKRT